MKTSTQIKQSPKKLDVASLMADITTASRVVTLSSLESLDMFQKVTVNIKAMELKDETQVGGKVKRDVSVADESGTARVSVWERNVNVMEKDRSYCLKNFMVREYQNTKYLTMAKEGSEIIPIEDIGIVADKGERDDELWVINNVTVAGVPYFDTYKSCLQCKARVEPQTERLGKCSKTDCMMMIFAHNISQPNSCSCMTRVDDRKQCLHSPTGRLFMRLLVVTMFQSRG